MSTSVGKYGAVVVGDIFTELYSILPPSVDTDKPCLVLFPGNPGVVDFYEEFAEELFAKLGKQYAVYVVGNAGHGAPGKNNWKLFSLEDQISHKIDFLRTLRDGKLTLQDDNSPQPAYSRFIVLAHSIGAYICLKTKARASDLKIEFSFLLMPTIRHLSYGLSPFIKMVSLPYIRNGFASLAHLSLIRIPLSHIILRFGMRASTSNTVANVIRNKAQYDTVLNALSMAYIEWCDVQHIDDELRSVLKNDSNKIMFIYSPIDPYTPAHFIEETKAEFPDVAVHVTDNTFEHAFVLKQSKGMAEKVVQFMKQFNLCTN